MLSEALQPNAKHEVRLSNISAFLRDNWHPNDQGFFASLTMTWL